MKLLNLMEDEVICTIDKILKEKQDICTCDKCKLDIAAIALNNLKPKYVVVEKGEVYSEVNTLNYQLDADLIKEIVKAIDIVGANPHHE